MVGIKHTIIRNCDGLNRLLEMNLYINVKANTYPDFTSALETEYKVVMNKTLVVTLPPIKDSDENDVPDVYVKTMKSQEKNYP